MTKALAVPASRLPSKLSGKKGKALEAWLTKLDSHTQRSYRRGLVHFAEWLSHPDQGVFVLGEAPPRRTPEHQAWSDAAVAAAGEYLVRLKSHEATHLVEAYLYDLLYPENPEAEYYTRSTVESRLAALRWAVRESKRMGQVEWELLAQLPRPQKTADGQLRMKKGRNMKGPTLTQARALIDKSFQHEDPRAPAIMSLLRFEGYREHEIRQLDLEHLDIRRAMVTMTRKKRARPSDFPLSAFSKVQLKSWLVIRGKEEGPLFYGGENGSEPGTRLSKNMISRIVHRVAELAGVENMSPHKIRHRACTDIVKTAVQQGLPEEEILYLTGHSSRGALQPYYEAAKSYKGPRAVLDAMSGLEDDED